MPCMQKVPYGSTPRIIGQEDRVWGAQSDQSPAAGWLFEFSRQKLKQHDLLATQWLLYAAAVSFALLQGQSKHGSLQ